ncbi:MAG: DUF5060 domain-containing protein [Candidatus Nealsonbacteria bacterium]|nr:DUF5060 domain-containing protein [Candidatus Nealsonbacteria bacterium]
MNMLRFCLYHVVALSAILGVAVPAGGMDVAVSQNTEKLSPYQVFELTLQHDGKYDDPTWDVSIDVKFRSPGGKRIAVGGFFYGSSKPQKPIVKETGGRGGSTAVWPCDPADLWKARYAPSELGRWTFEWVLRNPSGDRATGTGRFEVVPGRNHRKGFVRIHPDNPFRLVFDDGSAYFPIGFQDGIFDNNHNGSVMDSRTVEGPFRLDPEGRRPVPPPGAMFARGPGMGPINGDVDFRRHADAGFNLWRFSPNNFSIKVFAEANNANQATLDRVRWEQAIMVDEMLQMARKYKLRNFYGIFGYTPVSNDRPGDAEAMARVKRIVKYSVDRWGAYVDFWEFLNEQKAETGWYEVVIPYLKSIDPYGHPITTSWERPELDGIDVNAPHWYGNEPELTSARATADRAKQTKRFGKPVVYGEQGNYRGGEDQSARGVGGVWDPGSARRMRVRNWTAMFNEIAFIFWETSYAKDGHVRNIWIGPEERQYIRAMQDFADRLDRDVRMVEVSPSGTQAGEVQCYGLRSRQCAAVYLHHHACDQCKQAGHRWDHNRGEVKGLQVTVDVPKAGKAYWYRPIDGDVLAVTDAPAGRQTFTAPPFEIDLALLITDGPPPDRDGDGRPNHLDPDDDNDGHGDKEDAWPLEPAEWADADGDRIGDNTDADVDADGTADDRNGNGTPDNEETDPDGDGVPTAGTLPWDAFPRDPTEYRDTDGDGTGDRADADDDNDGHSDTEETLAGTDPLDPVSFP